MSILPWTSRTLRLALTIVLVAGSARRARAQADSIRPRVDSAQLSGAVRDSTGRPLADVEILLTDAGSVVRAGADGKFSVAAALGNHDVAFRKIGYRTARFLWVARFNEHTQISVSLQPLPHTLDPVIVSEREDRSLRERASIRGVVVDSSGEAIDEAEVQIVGANASGVTRANGGFLFQLLAPGPVLVRARKLGYTPNVLSMQLQPSEERVVIIHLTRLPATLTPVVVSAQSGYGSSQAAWDEFEKRRRWKTADDIVLGPADLQHYGSLPLDMAAKSMLNGAEDLGKMRASGAVHSFGNTQRGGAALPKEVNDVCILENGIRPLYQPLRLYNVDQIELLEIYPSNSELSGTVAARMDQFKKCRAIGITHPTYYVVWLKGNG